MCINPIYIVLSKLAKAVSREWEALLCSGWSKENKTCIDHRFLFVQVVKTAVEGSIKNAV